MARQARQKSELKVYHAILRGVNKQQILFNDDDDDDIIWKKTNEQETFATILYG